MSNKKSNKSTAQKIAALFATRKSEMEGELSRLGATEEYVQAALAEAHKSEQDMDMDTMYNLAQAEVGIVYGTDAQMVLDYILRHL